MGYRKNAVNSDQENFEEIAGTPYEIISQVSSRLGWEYTAIISGPKGVFAITHGQPDRGAPYVEYEKMNEEDAKLLQEKPTLKNFKKLVSKEFFNESFFAEYLEDIDLTSKKEQEYFDDLITNGAGKIKNDMIKMWYVLQKFTKKVETEFTPASKLRDIPFTSDVKGAKASITRTRFNVNEPSDLEVVYNIELPNEEAYYEEKHLIDPDTGKLLDVQKDPGWFKSFEPGTEFPIEEKTFADDLKIILKNQETAGKDEVLEIYRDGKKIYSFTHPTEAYLGGLRIFQESDKKFIYIIPMRNHLNEDIFFTLSFEYEDGEMHPGKYTITGSQEAQSIREDYIFARVPRKPDGTLGDTIEIYQM